MTIGEKLSRLRKENNLTQEQLAELLNVSRQAISKWESDVTFPETEKLIRISKLYNCSLDYLLKDEMDTDRPEQADKTASHPEPEQNLLSIRIRFPFTERKSQKELWGMPLYHVGKKARGVFAVGLDARGIVAFGLRAQGIVSFGVLSLGLLAFGVLALGLLSAGAFAAGILCAGAICLGVFSMGAVAVGDFAVGALAIGKFAALGDTARAMVAIGDTEATGSLFQKTGELSPRDIASVSELLDSMVPTYLAWAKHLFLSFI